MYRKIVWCYVFVLTLLDISLNTKLSAQGKSHGVSVHDSLIEGITFQEWGKESAGGGGRGRAVAAGALALSPPALAFGRAALAAAHALTVTLTNTANTTMHLASVAGTTPDFHASFFESKTLPPQANTTFSVVYLGRREGPVSAHLYIHTSLGVHKYPVSAVGVASEWGVWPLVGVRVPLNATIEPLLTFHNPTDQTIQVSEVYSSGSWLGLALPGGGSSAPRDTWTVPPRSARPLVRLRLSAPPHAQPLTAYVRIKANITGGGLLVCVEARGVAPGEYVAPLQLRLRARGSGDPPDTFEVLAGNSAGASVSLEASVWAARCDVTPAPEPAPGADGDADRSSANGNGVKSEGVYVSLLRTQLGPHQSLTRTAQLTLDYAKMWAGYGGEARGDAYCAGWLRLGRAALPYSLRLLPGTLRLEPSALHLVRGEREGAAALRVRELRVHNEFRVPVLVSQLHLTPDAHHFQVESLVPLSLAAGGGGVVARVRLRGAAQPERAHALLTLVTNLTDYTLPLYAYSGKLQVEWDWPNSSDGTLRLGVVGTSSTRRVGLTIHNAAPTTLCIPEHTLDLPGATLALQPCAHLRAPPPKHACRCIGAESSINAVLTVVAPAREGELRGLVSLWASAPRLDAPPALTALPVALTARAGRLAALPLHLYRAAPYAWSLAPLVLESSMALSMRVVGVTLPSDDPAVFYEAPSDESGSEVSAGRHAVGTVLYAPERLCEPHCYTGLDITTTEGSAWLRRASSMSEASLRLDAALQQARYARFLATPAVRNISLHVHTAHVVRVAARGAVHAAWPRLAPARAAAPLAGVGVAAPLALRARNPSAQRALLLQPVLGAAPLGLAGDAPEAPGPPAHGWALGGWRGTHGAVRAWTQDAPHAPHALPLLLLAPDAELEITLTFTPQDPAPSSAYLYLRNNLTILEGVQLSGRGAYPSFELGGRRPGSNAPLLFEVSGCGGTVRRTVLARNTGAVPVRLRDWRVAGLPCQARGFRLSPCAGLALAPNESRALTLAFTPDYTLARVAAPLSAAAPAPRAFLLRAAAPAGLLPRCHAALPRPPWEPRARAAAALLALAALALVLAAAALDAERELRRARQARPPPAARRPLDLRALAQRAAPEPAPPPPRRPPARRRRTPRRDLPPLDPHAERRAFERWRAEVLGRNDDDDSRSSEDDDGAVCPAGDSDYVPPLDAEPPEPQDEPPAVTDGYEADPETEDRPQGSGDDDAASTGSGSGSASASSSSPTVDEQEPEEVDEPETERPREHPAPPAGEHSPAPPRPDPQSAARAGRARRDASETPRRGERSRTADTAEPPREPRARPASAKQHARKDKLSKRRERPAASPPRCAEARGPPVGTGALRWGASWSSVVARGGGAALAPIGSDVRRREPERAAPPGPQGDHSLFYFNGDAHSAHPTHSAHSSHSAHACRDDDFSWRPPPPPLERPAFTPARDFLDEPSTVSAVGAVGAVGSGYRSLSSVWSSGLEPRGGGAAPAAAAWLWGGYAEPAAGAAPVRPPPGFGAPPRPVRPYDPFRSLASIWAPGALDWRPDADAPDEPH